MSTEHVNSSTPLGASEHDLEYGPTPPGAKYEHTDIDVNVGYQFALWLAVSMAISVAIVWGVFYFFESRLQSANTLAQKYPLAATMPPKAPPLPNLQSQPFKDVFSLRAGEDAKLTGYGWVDKEGGVTHIPIDRAMEVMLQRGFPSRPDGVDPRSVVVTQDSSSGRTAGPR